MSTVTTLINSIDIENDIEKYLNELHEREQQEFEEFKKEFQERELQEFEDAMTDRALHAEYYHSGGYRRI